MTPAKQTRISTVVELLNSYITIHDVGLSETFSITTYSAAVSDSSDMKSIQKFRNAVKMALSM